MSSLVILIKFLPVLKAMGTFIVSLFTSIALAKRISKQKEQVDEIRKAAKEAENAKTIEEKAKASCKIEVALGNTDCLRSDGRK